jgi:hypothetical protein
MASAIGPARAFFVRSQQLFPPYPFATLVIFPLKDANDLLGERRRGAFGELVLPQDFLTARMGQQIAKLQSGDIVGLGFHLQLLAGKAFLKLIGLHILRALLPKSLERSFQSYVRRHLAGGHRRSDNGWHLNKASGRLGTDYNCPAKRTRQALRLLLRFGGACPGSAGRKAGV